MIWTKEHMILFSIIVALASGVRNHGPCSKFHPRFKNHTKPFFTRPMLKESVMSVSTIGFVYCCIYGASNINWWFQNSKTKFQIIESNNYQFFNNKTTLMVLKPKLNVDTGFYKCVGEDDKGHSISNKTNVIVVKSTYSKDIDITDASDVTQLAFNQHSNYTFYCLVRVYSGFSCDFIWNRIKNGKSKSILAHSYLDRKRRNDTLIAGYSGYSQLIELNIDGNFQRFLFNLTIFDMRSHHEGEYSCLVKERNEMDERIFNIYIKSLGKEHIYIASGIIGSFILIMIMVLEFRYDFKIFLKKSFQFLTVKKKSFGSYNFFFLYDFDDEYMFKTIAKVVGNIENRQCSVYFYHRDQQYGKIMFEELYENLQISDVVVFWVSEKIWKNPISSFCIQMLIRNYPEKLRLYVMTSDKKNAMKNCNSSMISADTKSWIWSNTYFWNTKKSNLPILWHWHNLISWLISSLPIYSRPLC